MAGSANFRVTESPDEIFALEVSGYSFHIARATDSVTVDALDGGDTVEQLRSTRTDNIRRVFVFDQVGGSAAYTGTISNDLIETSVEKDGRTYQVSAKREDYPAQLASALQGLTLPKPDRILALAQVATSNMKLRAEVFLAATHGGSSADCEIACELALDPLSPGVQTFAAGYCGACTFHGW